ncbi:hypothetical protein IMAU60055_00734 [Lactiplantibacillus plantarum]|nr:hypothetical protein [Lactiplantibacillus plantarum]
MVKRQGFTLIETVAVLAIVASVTVIAVHRFPTRQRQQNAEQAFWRELQTMWQQQTLTASVTGQPQVVSFRGTEVVTWGGVASGGGLSVAHSGISHCLQH